MKKTFCLIFALCGLAFTACNDDSEENLDPNTPVYQHYEVDFYEQYVNAFANFRSGSANGELVKLNNGASILANGVEMMYYHLDNYEGAFDYSRSEMKDDNVTFLFKRSADKTYTHTISRSDISAINIPEDLRTFTNGQSIDVGFKYTGYETLNARLYPLSGQTTYYYNAVVDNFSGTFSFSNVPEGYYTMQVTVSRQIPTTQNDNGAGGVIKVYYVDMQNVVVEKAAESD